MTKQEIEKLASNPRASYAAWTRFAPHVSIAYRQHPKLYRFRPVSLTPASCASKMRDAIRGCIAFRYDQENGIPDLTSWWKETSVTFTSKEVIIGPKNQILTPLKVLDPFHFPTLSLNEIKAFLVLLSSGRIQGPITIDEVNPEVKNLPKVANTEVHQKSDGTLILL